MTILATFVTIILSVIFIVDFLLIAVLIITLWRFFK
uniref:E3 n=1 Tax=Lactococcus phage c6A TaxID=206060 RepID=Q7Y4F3_9CAUD|nr:E3 [Lactococcus phage c6A]